jgi:hypothetical protein
MHSLNRFFLNLLFHLHRNCFVCLIRFLGGFSFTFLPLHRGFLFSFHRLLKVFHRGFIFPLQRSFSTFTLPFLKRGFLFLLHGIFNAFTLLLLLNKNKFSGKDCSLKTSLGIDDLVKGLLPLISTAGGEEGKSSFFPFLDVALVE